jgi:hypothetical protein
VEWNIQIKKNNILEILEIYIINSFNTYAYFGHSWSYLDHQNLRLVILDTITQSPLLIGSNGWWCVKAVGMICWVMLSCHIDDLWNDMLNIFGLGLGLELWCVMPLSTIFHLYRAGQFYRSGKPEYLEKTTGLPQVTDNFIT